jgi:hypothetical protein
LVKVKTMNFCRKVALLENIAELVLRFRFGILTNDIVRKTSSLFIQIYYDEKLSIWITPWIRLFSHSRQRQTIKKGSNRLGQILALSPILCLD